MFYYSDELDLYGEREEEAAAEMVTQAVTEEQQPESQPLNSNLYSNHNPERDEDT